VETEWVTFTLIIVNPSGANTPGVVSQIDKPGQGLFILVTSGVLVPSAFIIILSAFDIGVTIQVPENLIYTSILRLVWGSIPLKAIFY
jgi:hypothetical protein